NASALAALADLRRAYARMLPNRVGRISSVLRSWRNAPDNARVRERARTLAHRLRGTAGSYGFPEVGAIVGRVEDAILVASDARLAAWDAIEADLQDAKRRIAYEIRELSRSEV